MNDVVMTEGAELRELGASILSIKFKPGVGIEPHHAEEIVAKAGAMFGSRPHGNLVDVRELMFMSQEARDRFASKQKQQIFGIALVVDSGLRSTMANLYMKISRPKIPTRVFSTESSARAWLEERRHSVHPSTSSKPPR